ncbi:MAG: hypothetical protein CME70_17000 [Halobacteriovorax sp.]|nr:hypothetical protein [Halobacteriovorax sp.]|tara:strand:- start:131552 stop:131785 length:234 start_codon:yes stop_codon:yes gene_type:complete
MKLLLIATLFFSTVSQADPLKKVLKRSDYCSPLQKLTGGCKKKNKKENDETQMESDSKKSNSKSKKKKEEEPEEFLR